MRHNPQADDPYLQTDRGVCPNCNGRGCEPPKVETVTRNETTGDRALLVAFDKRLTDDEMRDLHEYLKEWTP